MKVALVHDVIDEFGGAEKVLLRLLKLFPDADVYTSIYNRQSRLRKLISKPIKHSGILSHVPFISKASTFLKPLIYLYWELLDLSSYDLVISSSHSFSSKSIITGPSTRHVSYIHTPPRFLYTEYNETRILHHPLLRTLVSPLLSFMRIHDYIAAQRPDVLVANSIVVQSRIRKYYRRESVVIHPPVHMPLKVKKKPRGEFFVCLSRLSRQKGIDLAVQACTALGLPLVVVGEGSQRRYLESNAGPTIRFTGYLDDRDVGTLYHKALALIYPARDEDFGMVAVEAQSHGVPVIGFRSGGIPEIVNENTTGVLFDEFAVDSLKRAIRLFQKSTFDPRACRRQAEKFSEEVFDRKMTKLIDKLP